MRSTGSRRRSVGRRGSGLGGLVCGFDWPGAHSDRELRGVRRTHSRDRPPRLWDGQRGGVGYACGVASGGRGASPVQAGHRHRGGRGGYLDRRRTRHELIPLSIGLTRATATCRNRLPVKAQRSASSGLALMGCLDWVSAHRGRRSAATPIKHSSNVSRVPKGASSAPVTITGLRALHL
jgi:hypothetical protein